MAKASAVFSREDLEEIARHGLAGDDAEAQLRLLRTPPPYVRVLRPCTVGDGIVRLGEDRQSDLVRRFEPAAREGRVMRFVPASGAATRMFRSLSALRGAEQVSTIADLRSRPDAVPPAIAADARRFAEAFLEFPFAEELSAAMAREGLEVRRLIERGHVRTLADFLLGERGLAYADRPKALIAFHRYPSGARTALEEQLVESALYSRDAGGRCRIHFTVSPEHRDAFDAHLAECRKRLEAERGATYDVTLSVQHPSTDTIARDTGGRPFRLPDGSLLFRPGGHGALIRNLGDLGADIVFLKNIDNVQPDDRKTEVAWWKQVLGGLLVEIQDRVFDDLRRLHAGRVEPVRLDAALRFVAKDLAVPEAEALLDQPDDVKRAFLLDRLDRPLRVCGMVPNQGEPGGGPFWVRDPDGTVSHQIVEISQIDPEAPHQKAILKSATHFNPVDLVCGLRDFRGRPFDLRRFVDSNAVFIAHRSQDGRDLWALERPGLWNGGMAGWNAVFVETPIATFSPVKTVFDLLREEHRAG